MICHVCDVKSHESMGICGNLEKGNTWEYMGILFWGAVSKFNAGVMGVSQQQANYHFSGVRMRTFAGCDISRIWVDG